MDHRYSSSAALLCRSIFIAIAALAFMLGASGARAGDRAAKLQGSVQNGGTGLAGYKVSLFASFVDHGPPWKLLGSATSDGAGNFQIAYSLPPGLAGDPSIPFVQAERDRAMLASAIGLSTSAPPSAVVNERTTVATGNAFARFIDDRTISGNTYGMINPLRWPRISQIRKRAQSASCSRRLRTGL